MSGPGYSPRRYSMSDAFYLARHDPAENRAASVRRFFAMLRDAPVNHIKINAFLESLPRLTESDLATLGESDSQCPICLTTYRTLLVEEEMALVMDSPAHPIEELGVTRLVQTCGHIFCRKDIRSWGHGGNTTCPTCRRPFFTSAPHSDPNADATTVDADPDSTADDDDDTYNAPLREIPFLGERNPSPRTRLERMMADVAASGEAFRFLNSAGPHADRRPDDDSESREPRRAPDPEDVPPEYSGMYS
ncbi:hypothetical protein BD413DRAFT_586766 [Trametes elegans]|nr:hypothetical protein BD413DRAFT_586766 [Trametes elegans]